MVTFQGCLINEIQVIVDRYGHLMAVRDMLVKNRLEFTRNQDVDGKIGTNKKLLY